jgi:hypothetical protein
MSIKDFVLALNESIELNERVVLSLKDILLSGSPLTTIENTPSESSEYYNQKGVSYLYGREPKASDMFDGEAGSEANDVPYPVISDFALGETPNILEDHLAEKISTLSSINTTTRLVLGTLSQVISEFDDVIERNKLKVKSRVWKTFKVGEYWPVADGFSSNADLNSTVKFETNLQYNTTSKYAFIKLSPDRDVKHHFLTIDVDVLSDYAIPVIFIVLDSFYSIDGDQFEFRVEYKTSNTYTDQSKWPEILFFDSSYNSNATPQPSISKTYSDNEDQINNTVRINGVDYYYVQANSLPTETRTKYSLLDTDRVFVSAEELNDKIVNHQGFFDGLDLSNMKQSKYLGYGILSNNVLKTYSNRELNITAELANGVDSEVAQQVFARTQTMYYIRSTLAFSGLIGSSVFYGRPCSFFTPITTGVYDKVENYADSIEGVDGNVTQQYKVDKFEGYLTKPDNNGFVVEYEIDQSTLNGNIVSLRIGQFESILGLTIQYYDSYLRISYCKLPSDTVLTIAVGSYTSIKCLVGFISINGILYANYVVKSGSTIIHNSGLVNVSNGSYQNTLLAYRLLGSGRIDPTILQCLTEEEVYGHWNPVISVFVDGTSATDNTYTTLSNVLFRYGLAKEEFSSRVVEFVTTTPFTTTPSEYWAYANARGIFDPIVLKPEQISGYICSVDARSVNTYSSNNNQTKLLNSYRVGFTYTTYKGSVFSDKYVEYSPYVENQDVTISKEIDPGIAIKNTGYPADTTTLTAPSTFEEPVNKVVSLGGESSIEYVPSVHNISKTPQFDNVDGHFGWKISTYYQSIG